MSDDYGYGSQNQSNKSFVQRHPQFFSHPAVLGFGYGGALGLTAGTVVGSLEALSRPRGNRMFILAKRSMGGGAMFGIFVAAGFMIRTIN